MIWKDLYTHLYLRFVKQHKLMPSQDAINDIASGNRLIFGLCRAYHPNYGDEWVEFISPCLGRHIIQMLKLANKVPKRNWENDMFFAAYKNHTIDNYFSMLMGEPWSVSNIFSLYATVNISQII